MPPTANGLSVRGPSSPMPPDVRADLAGLDTELDRVVPTKSSSNLLVGTWNLRALSSYTNRWTARSNDSPKRDWHSMACIAHILDRFDVAAIQETRRDPSAIFAILLLLGPTYRVIASDVTEGDRGNSERLAYVYDSARVEPSGLVVEIVLPPADRLPELTAFAEWMRSWADRPNDWNENVMVLGDFNIDRFENPLWQAFFATGLCPPAVLQGVRRTIFDYNETQNYCDQIPWFTPTDSNGTTESRLRGMRFDQGGGNIDFVPYVLRDAGLTRSQMSWRISDHYPLWLEFTVPR